MSLLRSDAAKADAKKWTLSDIEALHLEERCALRLLYPIEASARSADPPADAGGQSAPSKAICHSRNENDMKTPEYEMNMKTETPILNLPMCEDANSMSPQQADYMHTRDMIDAMQGRIAALETTLAKLLKRIRETNEHMIEGYNDIIESLQKK